MSEVDSEDLNRVHERIDDVQKNRVEDLKDVNDCLAKIKKNIAGIQENLENQKETLEDVAEKTDNLAQQKKDWDKIIDNRIEMARAECPATDLIKLKKNPDKRRVLKKFAQDHPLVTGGSGAAVGAALLKIADVLVGLFG